MAIKEEQHDPEYESAGGQQRPGGLLLRGAGEECLQETAGTPTKTTLPDGGVYLGASTAAGACPHSWYFYRCNGSDSLT